MNKQEAIQILSTRDAHGVLCGYTSGATEALDMAIEALQDDWIPVSERLPEDGYEVDGDNRFLVTQSNSSVGIYVFNYNGNSEVYWKRNVVAWKPLPDPYVESEE